MTDEVIITEERIGHIKERHPADCELILNRLPQAIAAPDYLIEANRANTIVLLKQDAGKEEGLKVVLRLKSPSDPASYRNSVISFWHMGEATWKKTLKNKKVLYTPPIKHYNENEEDRKA